MKDDISFQGSSCHTVRKEFEIEGVSFMRFNQMKNKFFKEKYRRILCADIFCGNGTNVIGREVVDGSPIRILDGYQRSCNKSIEFNFWFSDIRPIACSQLETLVNSRYGISLDAHAVKASDAANILGEMMHNDPELYLYLVVDPNGPKDFPKAELENLIRLYSRRMDMNTNISATAINRQLGTKKIGYQLKSWIAGIENFDDGFVSSLTSNNRKGWIRKPINSDCWRWTMIPTFGCMQPHNDWGKQGYVDLDSSEGKDAVQFYCGGSK